MNNQQNTIVLFDYDGVLTIKVDFAGVVSRRYGVQESNIHDFFSRHLQSCLQGHTDMIDLLAEEKDKMGWNGSAESLFHALYVETEEFNKELLDYINYGISDQHSIYIATNQERHRHDRISNDERLNPYITKVFSSCFLGSVKPERGYYEAIYQILKKEHGALSKESIVFIDDLPENIQAAEDYGFATHLFRETRDFINYYEKRTKEPAFPELTTERLRLVQMRLNHARGYADILTDPATHLFITETGPVDESEAREKIARNRNAFDTGRSLYWSILGSNRAFLGFLAIHNYDQPRVSISFGVHPAYRRMGVAKESLEKVLNWSGLSGKEVKMSTHRENRASFALLSKLSLQYRGYVMTAFGERHVFTRS